MNDEINQEILNELRSLRRHSQVAFYISLLFMAVAIGGVTWLRLERFWRGYSQPRSAAPSGISAQAQETAWPGIAAALDQGDNQKALALAQSFVARQPGYHYAHATLGSVYVAMGNFTNAEAAYLRAIELYPDEENEKALAAIRKRLARERGTQVQVR
jgi:cytochrome c-type biogenesis protein CcmH/NrfG